MFDKIYCMRITERVVNIFLFVLNVVVHFTTALRCHNLLFNAFLWRRGHRISFKTHFFETYCDILKEKLLEMKRKEIKKQHHRETLLMG